jgi:hypothetical protein
MAVRINFRARARQHSDAAKRLIQTGDDEMLQPIALRLRMAIECLAYELLQSYQDEVDDGTMETWQPGRLIKELKEIDDSIESDRSLAVGFEEIPGEAAKVMHPLGTDARLKASWINKHWNALGSYLHEPTIRQQKDGRLFNADDARLKIAEVSDEIDRVLASEIFATNLRVNITLTCNCGFTITRRERLLRRDGRVTCANCKGIFGAEESDGVWKFFRLFHDFNCPKCRANNKFPAEELSDNRQFTCIDCGSEIIVMLDWCIRLKGDSSPAAQN